MAGTGATSGGEIAVTIFLLVQHGEKIRAAGDPPLSPLGIAQARQTAAYLRGQRVTRLYSSPFRRATETAQVLADALALPICLDERLRERMNWGGGPEPQSLEAFLADWTRATAERDFRPPSGDSSRAAGARLIALLDELAVRHPCEWVALVTHGGVTLDAMRNLFPEEQLARLNLAVLTNGPDGCAITRLVRRSDGYALDALASTAHLPDVLRAPHQP